MYGCNILKLKQMKPQNFVQIQPHRQNSARQNYSVYVKQCTSEFLSDAQKNTVPFSERFYTKFTTITTCNQEALPNGFNSKWAVSINCKFLRLLSSLLDKRKPLQSCKSILNLNHSLQTHNFLSRSIILIHLMHQFLSHYKCY